MKTELLTLIEEEFTINKSKITDIKEAIENLNFDGYDYINIDGGEYRIIPENLIENIFYDEVKELVQDIYLQGANLPSFIENNINWDGIVEECMNDGYGHHFNGYDGSEINGNGLYLFRNN